MKKIFTIILCCLLFVGVTGGSFALAKHFDENPPASVEDNSSKQDDDSGKTDVKTVQIWELCTDSSDLAVGDQIVLVASSNERALSLTQNTNNRAATKIVKEENSITINDDVQIITLEEGVVENTFAFNVGDGYLYAPSSASNHLRTKTAIDANGSWSITIDEGAVANIVAQGESTINVLQYNSNNHIFSCYTSTQEAILIYKLVEREIEL